MNDIREKAIKCEAELYGVATNQFVDGFVNGYQQGMTDVAREFAEWFAECTKVSKPIKEYIINRWLEDFAEWQKGKENG